MTTDMATYDPSKLMDSVRDRIRSEFVKLIPEEAWASLVKKEIDQFFKEEASGYRSQQSGFQRIVWGVLEDRVKDSLKEYFDSEEWRGSWNSNGKPVASKVVNDLIKNNMQEIVTGILGGALQSVLQNMRMHL